MKTATPWLSPNGTPLTKGKIERISKSWDTETWDRYSAWQVEAAKDSKRPWLTKKGTPLAESRLKKTSRSWNAKTWSRYLDWYERPCKETLIGAKAYDMICEERTETIYKEYGSNTSGAIREFCKKVLDSLPPRESQILKLHFYQDMTFLQIGQKLGRPKSTVYDIKTLAVSRAKAKFSRTTPDVIHIMRGLTSQKVDEAHCSETSLAIGDQPIREDRIYRSEWWRNERTALKNPKVKNAVAALTDFQWKCAYRRFWCNEKTSAIARDLGVGINSVEDACEVATAMIVRHVASQTTWKQENAS